MTSSTKHSDTSWKFRDECLDAFADYLARSWCRSDFVVTQERGNPNQVSRLGDLLNAYIWQGKDFEANERELVGYSESLRRAINERDDENVHDTCLKIMKWGGVYSTNFAKDGPRSQLAKELECRRASRSLAEWLTCSVEHLKKRDFKPFEEGSCFSNSTMTKIHALADPDNSLIIYDGRVGAALGFLARTFLETTDGRRFLNSSGTVVPIELRFAFMAGRPSSKKKKRDPSEGKFKFRPYGVDHGLHARCSYLAACCVGRSQKLLSKVSMRQIEAALFMLGDDLNRVEKVKAESGPLDSGVGL